VQFLTYPVLLQELAGDCNVQGIQYRYGTFRKVALNAVFATAERAEASSSTFPHRTSNAQDTEGLEPGKDP